MREYQKAWVARNKEKAALINRRSHIKRRFGLTLEEYTQKFEDQGGVCAICLQSQGTKLLAIDHCHSTDKVRGLLCHRCNTALGSFDDNVEVMYRAIQYIEEYRNGR